MGMVDGRSIVAGERVGSLVLGVTTSAKAKTANFGQLWENDRGVSCRLPRPIWSIVQGSQGSW